MSTITKGRTVLYTFKRWADAEPVTRPAIVADVVTALRNKAPNPMSPSKQREREEVEAVKLVVMDETGVRPLDHAVFEDTVCEDGAPAVGCWGWPPRTDAPAATASSAVATKDGAKKKR